MEFNDLIEENARLRAELEAELLRTHMLKPVMDEYERLKAQKESILAKQQDKLTEENARLRAELDTALVHNAAYEEKSEQLREQLAQSRRLAQLSQDNEFNWMKKHSEAESRLSRAIAALQGIAWSAGSSGNTGHIMLPTIKRRADEVLKELEG